MVRRMTGARKKKSTGGKTQPLTLKQTRDLGTLIRDTREAKKLTREQVFAETGVSVTAQYWAEAGERDHDGKPRRYKLRAQTLLKLAQVIGLTPLQLAACGRLDVAALLRAPTLPGDLSDQQKTDIAAAVVTLRRAVPNFEALISWVGAATGDVPLVDGRPEA